MMCRWVRCSSMGQAHVVHREGVGLADPGDREDAEQLVADLDRLDQQRGVGHQVQGRLVEARVRLAVARLQRGAEALDQVDERIVGGQGQAGERLAQLPRHVVAGERDEAVPAAGHAPRDAGVGAEDAHHLAGRAADGLGEVRGRADRLADREQRLGLLQPLLDLVVQARLLERDRGLGGQGGGEPDLFLGEDVEGLQVVQDEDTGGAALVDERHHQRRLGLEETDPALRHPGVAPGVGDDDRLLAAHRLQQEGRHLLERQGAQGLGAVAARLRGGLVGELRADRHHELARLVAQEDRAAVDAAGARGSVGDDLEELLLLERGADGLRHLEHPVGLLRALLDRLQGLPELLGRALQLLGAVGRALGRRAGLRADPSMAPPRRGEQDQAEAAAGGQRDDPRDLAPALVSRIHAQRHLRQLHHADHARCARGVDRHVQVGDVGRDEVLGGGGGRRQRGEPHRHPAREGVPQLLALGVLPDRPGLHGPHHVALGIPHLDLNDARKVAHESGALVGPALGAARALAGQQLRQAAAIHRSLGDRRGLGPLRLGGHHVEEPAQPDAEGAGEDRDPGQADEDGAQQRPERYPRHEGLPCRSSASRLDSSSGKRSAETGRAK